LDQKSEIVVVYYAAGEQIITQIKRLMDTQNKLVTSNNMLWDRIVELKTRILALEQAKQTAENNATNEAVV
jgi:hypothetical protein